MTVSVTQYPTYPIPGRPVRLTFTVTDGEYVKVFITDAPKESTYWKRLDDAGAARLLLHSGDADKPWTFTADVAGKFVFTVQDITKGATGHGGGYYGSAGGYQTETVNAESTGVTITAGSKLEMPIGWGEDTATLRLYVWDDTIHITNVATHGEATPGIFDPSSERADNAAQAAAVETALAALVPSPTWSMLTTVALTPTLESTLTDIITKFAGSTVVNNDHLDENQDGAVHNVSDSDNNISTAYLSADNPARIVECAVELWTKLDQHMRNDAVSGGVSYGTGSGNYHNVAANSADYENSPITGPPSTVAEAVSVIADCWRAYEAHRIDTTYHGVADSRNPCASLPPLLEPFRYFFVELAKTIPAFHDTDNDGAKHLAAAAGMTET